MAGKMTFLVGFGAGYVLGTRSGRERYDQMASKAQQLLHDRRVQETAAQVQQAVKDKVGSGSSTNSTGDPGAMGTGTP